MLFALMGTIGVGYLLNGTTAYETVNDYEYVTDVSGLYTYTPVTAYAAYSPAQNNYQYNTDSSLLGTYTDGITYTAAAAANLNPIITPSTGYQETTQSLSFNALAAVGTSIGDFRVYLGSASGSGQQAAYAEAYLIPASRVLDLVGAHSGAVTIDSPTTTITYGAGNGGEFTVQQFAIAYYGNAVSSGNMTSEINYTRGDFGAYVSSNSTLPSTTSPTYRTHAFYPTDALSSSYYINTAAAQYYLEHEFRSGWATDISLNANGTLTYTSNLNGLASSSRTIDTASAYFVFWKINDPDWSGQITEISYTTNVYVNADYLDPNYGVAVADSSDPVYWSNSNNLGSVTWAFKKPDSYGNIQIYAYNSSTSLYSFNVTYANDDGWRLTYYDYNSTDAVYLGPDWSAIYVRMYYTGELQAGALDGFFNFTNYTMKLPTTYSTAYSGNVPITMCKIVGTTTMNFACIETTVESGTVPGAMYDASFDVSGFFPSYTNVRMSFNSAAYVGSSVTTGTWTMAVDSSTFVGTFTVDTTTYYADLTQPWALIWDPDGHVDITFTGVNELGTQTVTILDSLNTPAVALGGQWVLDTDLYKVSNHVAEVYDWNFGEWGLDKTQFIVCAMGLTALISILMKLGGVPFRMLDFVVILFGNVILWVIM